MLSVGIVGLPNVGKSSLFKALTKNPVDINNYPFCTIDPNIGIVSVADNRIENLAKLSASAKKIPAIIEFYDIAGLVKGAHKGEGLGNQFLANIRSTDLICHVVRFFESENIHHVESRVNPKNDIEVINTELVLADMATAEKRKHKAGKLARGGDKEATVSLSAIDKLLKGFDENKLAKDIALTEEEKESIKDLNLITLKPVLYVFNVGDKNHPDLETLKQELPNIELNVGLEKEISELTAEEAAELGLESGIHKLAQRAYDTLGLITFFTTGEMETRAWTVTKGSTAPVAGSKIHNDFMEKFIRAEVISYNDFVSAGSYKTAREQGMLRTEGREYIVQDGDIMIFKI